MAIVGYAWLRPASAGSQFWQAVVDTPGPVLVAVGDVPNGPPRLPEDLSTPVPSAGPAQTLPLADAMTAARVVADLENRHKQVLIRRDSSLSFSDLRERAVVLIGAFNNQWSLRLTHPLRYSLMRIAAGVWRFCVPLSDSNGMSGKSNQHRSGYVESPDAEGWFIHFQDRRAHCRIVHLEPVRWQDGWPLVGDVKSGSTTGEPVRFGPMPDDAQPATSLRPQTSDDFSSAALGPQWEWNHNTDDAHCSLTDRRGYLRIIPLQAEKLLDGAIR
jgi:hypothetical protein